MGPNFDNVNVTAGVPRGAVNAAGAALIVFWFFAVFVVLGRMIWRYPMMSGLVLAPVTVGILAGPSWAFALVLAIGIVGLLWSALAPAGYERWIGRRLRGEGRRFTVYGLRWKRANRWSGLSQHERGWHAFPKLTHVQSTPARDVLTVRMLIGQTPEMFEQAAGAFAHAFGALSVRVHVAAPGTVLLEVVQFEPLAGAVYPPPIPEHPGPLDLDRLVIGVTEYGRELVLSLSRSIHLLIAGATNSGKASWLWSIVYALAPWVRTGQVQLYGIDPKGGMELGMAPACFTKLVYGNGIEAVELIEHIADETQKRAERMRGRRTWSPDCGEPFKILLLDELGALLAYQRDNKLRDRTARALELICTQGRAPGVMVIGALQDPRKEKVPFRNLFPTRIALRLDNAAEVDMVLGDGVRDRGANAHQIPHSLPGVAWMKHDDQREPERVRALHVTDDHLAYLNGYIEAGRYLAPPMVQIAD